MLKKQMEYIEILSRAQNLDMYGIDLVAKLIVAIELASKTKQVTKNPAALRDVIQINITDTVVENQLYYLYDQDVRKMLSDATPEQLKKVFEMFLQ